ncbi:hypothetical protein [Xenorhabdus bharatensis]|uniref:hypothetical protein n=1 Tax=Xenorhabdus bharatensis TaxID=3136256 RepID=UPI0030F481BF
MPSCPNKYLALPCDLLGSGTLGESFCQSGNVKLRSGQGRHFPEMQAGQMFHALISPPCDPGCEEVIVTGRNGDTLTISRFQNRQGCFPVGSRIVYTACSVDAIRAIARESRPNYAYPLVYDCETDTVSIDCAGIKELVRKPCGVTNEN